MAIETETVNGYTIRYEYDEYTGINPRDDDTHGCEFVLSHDRYNWPNDAGIYPEQFDHGNDVIEGMTKALTRRHDALYVATVYAYEHGQIAFTAGPRVYPFNCQFDSGVAGLAYVTRKNWAETQGPDNVWTGSAEQLAQAQRLIEGDLETFQAWCNGEVYGYVITDAIDSEEIESCWGFIGDLSYCQEAARQVAKSLDREPKCVGQLNRKTGEIEHTSDCPIHGSN